MLYVTLSADSNPDYADDANDPRGHMKHAPKKVRVADLEEAVKVCRQFIRQNNLGGGNWTGGDVTDERGKLVAKVSYNGRVWEPSGKEIRLAYSYSRTASVETRMKSGAWYTQANGLGTLWFRAANQHESGGFYGHIVEWRSRRPHAKTAAVPVSYWDRWVEVNAADVPEPVKAAAGPLRTAAKKPAVEKKPTSKTVKEPSPAKKKADPKDDSARTDGTKKSEVEKALSMIEGAIDAILDCAPNARDFHEEGSYDSKAYAKAVAKHNETVDGLHDILDYLRALEPVAQAD